MLRAKIECDCGKMVNLNYEEEFNVKLNKKVGYFIGKCKCKEVYEFSGVNLIDHFREGLKGKFESDDKEELTKCDKCNFEFPIEFGEEGGKEIPPSWSEWSGGDPGGFEEDGRYFCCKECMEDFYSEYDADYEYDDRYDNDFDFEEE